MGISFYNCLRFLLVAWLISTSADAAPAPDPMLAHDINMARIQLEAHIPKYPAAELTRLAETLGRSNNLARAIQQAVLRDDQTNAAELLAQFPGTPDDIDFGGETLLLNSISRDKPDMLKLLLQYKANPNRTNFVGDTALLRALQNGHFDDALMLLEAGADALHTNAQGASPLSLIVRFNWGNTKPDTEAKLLLKLLDGGADPFLAFDGQTRISIIEQALRNMNSSVGDLLLTNLPGVDRLTPQGDTALHLAVEWNRTNAVEFLLTNGFSINQTNSEGLTPLQVVAQSVMSRAIALPPVGVRISSMVRSRTGPVPFVSPGMLVNTATGNSKAAWLLDHGAILDIWSAAALGRTNELSAMLATNAPVANALDGLGRSPLHYAALASQVDSAKILIRAGSDLALRTTKPIRPTVTQFGSETPAIPPGSAAVHFACLSDNGPILQLLLRCGATADNPDDEGNLPLHVAAHHSQFFTQTNCAWLLLNLPVPLDATNNQGRTALRLAVEGGVDRLVELLLASGARQDIGLGTNSLMHIAASQGNQNTISNLLAHGRSVSERDAANSTPFQYAAIARQAPAMKFLLSKGADINAADNLGNTALHLAAAQQYETIGFFVDLPWLKRWEQNWLTQPGFRRTTITNLIRWKILSAPPPMTWTNQSLVLWLLERHANPNLANQQGQTPLLLILEQPWMAYNSQQVSNRIAALLKAGARVDAKDSQGRTPIHLAAKLTTPAALSLLVQHATNFDSILDSEGRTALHYAVTTANGGYQPTIGTNAAVLLARGANPNIPDKHGLTPLHLAITNRSDQRLTITKLLLDHHADPNARDSLGRTPLHALAKSMRDGDYFFRPSETIEALIKAGANPTLLDSDGQTILHLWCDQGRVHSGNVDQILRDFVVHHPDLVNLTNAAGETPLHYALRSQDFIASQSLMQHGADPSLRNARGETAYYMAAKFGYNNGQATQIRPRGTTFSFSNTINTRNQREFDLWLDADPSLAKLTFGNGETPLMLATRAGVPRQFADRLLGLGAPLDLFSALRLNRMTDFHHLAADTNRLSFALLAEAIQLNRFVEIEDVAVTSPELRSSDSEGHSLLFHVHAGRSDITAWLRDHGVNQTMFDAAASGDTNFLTGVLATNRSLAGDVNHEGQSLLMLAARHGRADSAAVLIAHGAEIDAVVNGCTALTFACARGDAEVADQLLAAGANPDVRQSNGLTPLHLAAIGGHTKTVALLLDHGVDPDQVQTNRTDNYPTMAQGSTALHWAANWSRLDVVKLLLQRGANVHILNEAGDSPLDVVPSDFRGNASWYITPPRTGFSSRPSSANNNWDEVDAALVAAGATRKKEFIIQAPLK